MRIFSELHSRWTWINDDTLPDLAKRWLADADIDIGCIQLLIVYLIACDPTAEMAEIDPVYCVLSLSRIAITGGREYQGKSSHQSC